eukprot:TRINITY_DN7178_c0_g1_i1.p1 TRINITY_DN7178_c0_g1~~TRINITY_DN7178_c0_g1_i1.p1  ORF type:complete len:256 (+),score=63.74 TRINITY_DN7178_c0_g1_i1:150-917(+)
MSQSSGRMNTKRGNYISYKKREGKSPGVVFIPGFMSHMNSAKGEALDKYAQSRGLSYVRFDPFGHGDSSGHSSDALIGTFRADLNAILDKVCEPGPQILVGSSIGGWMMLLASLDRKDRISGLVGLAAAPDASGDIILNSLNEEQRKKLESGEKVLVPSPYNPDGWTFCMKFFSEAESHFVMNQNSSLDVDVPIRLIHGMKDEVVPWSLAVKLSEKVKGKDVQVILVKDGDHRLSKKEDLELLERTIDSMLLPSS